MSSGYVVKIGSDLVDAAARAARVTPEVFIASAVADALRKELDLDFAWVQCGNEIGSSSRAWRPERVQANG